jgi:ABC-type branched-subunit amino acid transport system substrate-binding protein
LTIGYWLSVPAAAELNPPASTPAPFLRLRDTTLGYHGPAADFTNLTEIRIGWFGPTNLDDPLTGDLWWAANLAVQQANAQSRCEEGGANRPDEPSLVDPTPNRVGRDASPYPTEASDLGLRTSDFDRLSFRLVPRWAVDPWGTGVSQLTRMVYDEQPLALLGSVDSATTHLAEQVVAKANLPLVSSIATDKSITLAGVSWMFSCAPSDDAIARVLVDAILAALTAAGTEESAIHGSHSQPVAADVSPRHPQEGLRRLTSAATSRKAVLAMVSSTDHESRMITREVVREFSRRGRMPDFRFDVPPGVADLSRQMEGMTEVRPGVVLIIAGVEDAARLVCAVRNKLPLQAHSGPVLFGSHSMGRARFRELAGPAAEGVRFPLLFTADPGDPRYSRFASRFQAERGRAPDYTAVLTYDATRLLIEAIRKAGPNRARIREALRQLSPWPGLAGPIQFDGTGQNTRTNICLGTISNGSVVAMNR